MYVWVCIHTYLQTLINTDLHDVSSKAQYSQIPKEIFPIPSDFMY